PVPPPSTPRSASNSSRFVLGTTSLTASTRSSCGCAYPPRRPRSRAIPKVRHRMPEPFTAEPLVLGIETSCDETGVGIVRGTQLLTNTIASSMDEHARYGGVVPEIAARAHLEALTPTL